MRRWSSEARRGALAVLLMGALLADLALAGWVGWRWVQGPEPGPAGEKEQPADHAYTVLMMREGARRIQSEQQIWDISRESWILDGALLEYRLWVTSVRWRARDAALGMNRLSQWALCSQALRALPKDRPEGVTPQRIDRVALHLPGAPEDQWVRMEVTLGICAFPGSPPKGEGGQD